MGNDVMAPARRAIDRRTLVRGAAWSVPVVATAAAAPAFAASCTQLYPGTLDWAAPGAYTRTSSTSGTGSFTAANGVTVGLTLTSTFTNYTASTTNVRPTANLGVTPAAGQTPPTIGGIGAAALTLCQTPNTIGGVYVTNNVASRQSIQFTFNRPVFRVELTLTDIDSANNQYDDAIAIVDQPATGSAPAGSGSTVVGAGTATSPWPQPTNNTTVENFDDMQGNYRVVVASAAGFTTFRMLYWNKLTPGLLTAGSGRQTIYLSSLTAFVKNTC